MSLFPNKDQSYHYDRNDVGEKLGFDLDHKTGRYIVHSEEERKRLLVFLLNNPRELSLESIALYVDYPLVDAQKLSEKAKKIIYWECRKDKMCHYFDAGGNDDNGYNYVMRVYIRSRAESLMELVSHTGLEKFKKIISLSAEDIAECFKIPTRSVELLLDGKSIDEVVDDFMSMDSKVWAKCLREMD